MVATEQDYFRFLSHYRNKKFTIQEAMDFIEYIDSNFPYVINRIDWIDCNTGNNVAIGYNHGKNIKNSKDKKNIKKCGIPEIKNKVMKYKNI